MAEISLPKAEAAGVMNWHEHLTDNFDKLIEAEYGLA